ncbi:MAG: hypothetical protein A3G39_02320 [Deltaproteobacteria bacterium RIFCSPLOWO2_12_FULL_43_16]|nr:MAG: hypothetical protein A3G39_02320 [Deltaproteobacteria bacterium RIFCSPLOWO2_12_FULL_43_16]
MMTERLNIAAPILIALLTIHLLVMYSIRPYGYNLSAMMRLTETEENGQDIKRYFQKGMVIFSEGGYDGQNYYYVAMDSIFKMDYKNAYRQQRMLYPLLSKLLTFGDNSLLPYTMYLVNLASLALGMYFFILILRYYSLNPMWSLFYGLSPPSIMTIQYDLPSPLSIFLIIAAVYFYICKGRIYLTVLFFAFAFLTREDSLLVLLPLLIWDFQKNRSIGRGVVLASSLIPFVLWQFYITFKIGKLPTGVSAASTLNPMPFYGVAAYFLTVKIEGIKQLFKIGSVALVFLYFTAVFFIMIKALIRGRNLFYYVVGAYCILVLFTVPSQWDNYNGLLRMFYGMFPFLVLSYSYAKETSLRYAVYFIAVLIFLTGVRILFVSPVYPFTIW